MESFAFMGELDQGFGYVRIMGDSLPIIAAHAEEAAHASGLTGGFHFGDGLDLVRIGPDAVLVDHIAEQLHFGSPEVAL